MSSDSQNSNQDADDALGHSLEQYLGELSSGENSATVPEGEEVSLRAVINELVSSAESLRRHREMPTRIGKYILERQVGSGGQSTTYLATDPDLQRSVVLKFYHQTNSPEACQAILEEGRLLSRVDSSYVVRCLAAECVQSVQLPARETLQVASESIPFLVLEFIDGTSLNRVLKLRKISTAEATQMVEQLCKGLSSIHKAGLIHRDIKPGNIVVDQNGRPTLVDFGLALEVADDSGAPGSGTANYMSPEQASGQPLDERTDIFGLGAVMYELLGGLPPYRGTTRQEIVGQAVAGDIEDLADLNPSCPPHLVSICTKCLAFNPTDRYENADCLLADLQRSSQMRGSASRSRIVLAASVLMIALAICTYVVFLKPYIGRSPEATHTADQKLSLLVDINGGIQRNGIYEFDVSDKPSFQLQLSSPGYVCIWAISDEKSNLIYPNAAEPAKLLSANESILLLDPERAGLKLSASAEDEVEFFRVLAAREPVTIINGNFEGRITNARSAEVQVYDTVTDRTTDAVQMFIPFRVVTQSQMPTGS